MGNLRRAIVCCLAAAGIAAVADVREALAEDCPGNPDALGTSRVLAVQPDVLPRVGIMQYRQSLPLADKEVVLTFDDGPLPPYSEQILDILAAQCVKATYFLVGRMARAYPAAARRIYQAGHTIGTHSEDHPSRFRKLSVEKVRVEIDQGIADVAAALGDPKELAPFFRIPGLARSDTIERELAARSLVVFSSDTVADDWHRRIRSSEIVRRAMSRLEKRGKGILLLHDIHPATVAALPGLLRELKEKGFRIVHVVPAETPAPTATMAAANNGAGSLPLFLMHRIDPGWPDAVANTAAGSALLPAPDPAAFHTNYRPRRRIMLADRTHGASILAVAHAGTQWPERPEAAPLTAAATLPAPSLADFGLPVDQVQFVGAAAALP
jgi:peptidoglycan/xylan/chitin deacetylase (PgdA/CDA1 family)